MFIGIKKAFAFVYWSLQKFFESMFDDGWSDFKAEAVIMIGELGALGIVVSGTALLLGHQIISTHRNYPAIFAIVVAVVAANHVILRDWRRFEDEFKHYSARVRIGGGIAGGLIPVSLVALAVLLTSLASHLPRLPG